MSNLQSGPFMIGLGTAIALGWMSGAFAALIDDVSAAVRSGAALGSISPATSPIPPAASPTRSA